MNYNVMFKRKYFIPQTTKCCYCGIILNEENCNVEHIIPKSKGGGTNKSNLTFACVTCNRLKLDRSVDEFKEMIKERILKLKVELAYYKKIING